MIKFFLIISVFLLFNTPLFAQNPNYGEIYKSGTVKSKTETSTLPISIFQDFITFKVKINGIEGTFLWDNGFSTSCLGKEFAKKVGAKTTFEKKVSVTDAQNDNVELPFFKLKELNAGSIKFNNFQCVITDLTAINSELCDVKIDGIFGASMINRLNWDFNFDEEKVRISTAAFNRTGAKKIPFIIAENQHHFVQLTINDFKIEEAMIDFGSNAEDLNIQMQGDFLFTKQKNILKIGSYNQSLANKIKIDSIYLISNDYTLKIGEHIIQKVPYTELSPNTLYPAILGNQFFRNTSNVIINTQQKNYLLYNRVNPVKEEQRIEYGIIIRLIEGKWILIGLVPEHPDVANSHIKLLDEVVAIDQKNMQDFAGICAFNEYISNVRKASKALKVTFKNGTSVTFSPVKL